MLTAYENTGVASASAVQVTQCLPPILHLAGDIRPFKRKISAKPKRLMEPHKERIYLAATTQATSAELVLIRGLPGSAKTTIASVLSMIGYLKMVARNIRVIEAKGRWETVHGVPPVMMERMAARLEPLPDSMTSSSLFSM